MAERDISGATALLNDLIAKVSVGMPAGVGFAIVMFDTSGEGAPPLVASNVRRPLLIAALKQAVTQFEKLQRQI